MWNVLLILLFAGLAAWIVCDSRRERRESEALRADTAKLYLALQEFNRVFGGIEGMTLEEAERECHARSD